MLRKCCNGCGTTNGGLGCRFRQQKCSCVKQLHLQHTIAVSFTAAVGHTREQCNKTARSICRRWWECMLPYGSCCICLSHTVDLQQQTTLLVVSLQLDACHALHEPATEANAQHHWQSPLQESMFAAGLAVDQKLEQATTSEAPSQHLSFAIATNVCCHSLTQHFKSPWVRQKHGDLEQTGYSRPIHNI